jgi:two-component system, OmpR family, phosphate regulon sensor histidine kinase PhoR
MERLNRIWKFYIIYTAILIFLVVLTGFILRGQLKGKMNRQLGERVFTLAKVLVTVLPDTADPARLNAWCHQYEELTEARITVIEKDGIVIGDSGEESIIGENRLDRPEVRGALAEGTATAVRYSKTLEADMFYAAFFSREKEKIIRLALPLKEVKAVENEVMIFFVLVLYLIPILAIAITFVFIRHVASENSGATASRNERHERLRPGTEGEAV